MRGHLKKRASWEYVAELGMRPLQSCPASRQRFGMKRDLLSKCPLGHGPWQAARKRSKARET